MTETAVMDSTRSAYRHLCDMAEPIYQLDYIVSLLIALTMCGEIDPVALRPIREALIPTCLRGYLRLPVLESLGISFIPSPYGA